jgi:hypothetical protein
MNLLDEKDQIVFYKYRVKELYLLFEDENYKLNNSRLKDVIFIEDYIENLYPIFKVDIAVEKSVYMKIIKNKDTLKIKANIQKFYRIGDSSEKSVYYSYINDTFQLILDDDDDDLGKDAYEKEFPDGDEDKVDAIIVTMELFLFKKNTIKGSRTLLNKIFQKCTITNAIMYLLGRLGVTNVLMDKADNKTSYDELKLPPLTINEEFRFLDSYYGIHKHGTVTYFGLTRSYILRFYSTTNAYEKGEIEDVCFIIPKKGSSVTDSYAMVDKAADKTKYYIIVDPDQFTPQTQSTTQSVLSAENITVVHSSSGEIEEDSSDEGDSNNKKIIVAHGVNPYYTKMYRNIIRSAESVIEVFVKDCDISVLEPNKHYSFLFEDTSLAKKYKGKYFLCKKEAILSKQGTEFECGATLTLRKMS